MAVEKMNEVISNKNMIPLVAKFLGVWRTESFPGESTMDTDWHTCSASILPR